MTPAKVKVMQIYEEFCKADKEIPTFTKVAKHLGQGAANISVHFKALVESKNIIVADDGSNIEFSYEDRPPSIVDLRVKAETSARKDPPKEDSPAAENKPAPSPQLVITEDTRISSIKIHTEKGILPLVGMNVVKAGNSLILKVV